MRSLSTKGITAAILVSNVLFFNTVTAQQENAPTINNTPPVNFNNPALQADVLFFDATQARLKGDKKQAESMMQQVVKLKPDASGAWYDLAILNMPEQPEKATEYIKKAIALEGDNKWYQDKYAEILAYRRKYEEAGAIYTKLAKTEKHNKEYLAKSALLYQHIGNNKEALAALDKLLEKSPGDEEIMMQKQQLYLKMNDVAAAAGIAQQMIDQNPYEGRYYAILAEIYNNNKQPEKAAEVYKKAEAMLPDDPALLLSLAQYYKGNNNQAKYKEYVKKAINSKGLEVESKLDILRLYMQDLGDDSAGRAEALDIAAEVAKQNGESAQVLGVYGDLLSLNGKQDEAVKAYKKAIDIDPSGYRVWQSLLYAYTGREDADSLIFYSEKAMRLFPNQAMIHYLNGIGYMNKKNYLKAVNSIQRAIDMQPEENTQLLADMYTSLGDAYNGTGQPLLSDAAFDKALKLDEDNATVLNNYAYYLSVRGKRLEDAERMSKKSLELRPGEATFMDTYGWILYKQGKYEKAKEYIQKAIDASVNPDATLWDHLGDIYFQMNDVNKAVECWQKAKDKGADDEQKITKKIQDRKLYE